MPKRKKFVPIEIHTDSPSEIFELYKIDISKAIINAISHGISYKKKKVDFAYIMIKDMLVITLSIDKREFNDLIDDNLKTLIDSEEYETCALAVKLKNKLNENTLKENRMVV
jgi:hypothetical protein